MCCAKQNQDVVGKSQRKKATGWLSKKVGWICVFSDILDEQWGV